MRVGNRGHRVPAGSEGGRGYRGGGDVPRTPGPRGSSPDPPVPAGPGSGAAAAGGEKPVGWGVSSGVIRRGYKIIMDRIIAEGTFFFSFFSVL